MTMIDTRTHGMIDYAVGVLLIVAPFILGFATGGPGMWVPIIIGLLVIGMSLFTDYELGLISRRISMRTHLAMDMATGFVLLASPWVFGFAHIIWWPHVLVGVAEIGIAAMTQRVPADRAALPHAGSARR
jgi:hypothetical protein